MIPNFTPYAGQHCETNATGNLLAAAGVHLDEPMLFGLGQGIGFGVFRFKAAPAPFLGGRRKFEEITQRLAANLGFQVDYKTTTSKKRAWANIASFVDQGIPVAAKLDAYYLDYFTTKIHFAAHYLAVFGYDDELVHVADTSQQGAILSTDRERFEVGRFWKGPMSSSAMTWTVRGVESIDVDDLSMPLRVAISANAREFLNPPIRNLGYKGISKAAGMVSSWFDDVEDAAAQLERAAMLMERGGTGGAMFRNFYTEFLGAAHAHLGEQVVLDARELFSESANNWTQVAACMERAAKGEGAALLRDAAALMESSAALEHRAMTLLDGLDR